MSKCSVSWLAHFIPSSLFSSSFVIWCFVRCFFQRSIWWLATLDQLITWLIIAFISIWEWFSKGMYWMKLLNSSEILFASSADKFSSNHFWMSFFEDELGWVVNHVHSFNLVSWCSRFKRLSTLLTNVLKSAFSQVRLLATRILFIRYLSLLKTHHLIRLK